MNIVDLHTHSLLSDGLYLPMELARRAERRGYRLLAVSDHVDPANVAQVVPGLVRAAGEWNRVSAGLRMVPAAEVTHVPPPLVAALVEEARRLGARLVLVHGETTSEPVAPGTNRAAIEAGADLLAHPGLISEADFRLARERGVPLELSARQGHCLSNGRLVALWRRHGGTLVINTDAHQEDNLFTPGKLLAAGCGAGLAEEEVAAAQAAARALAEAGAAPGE